METSAAFMISLRLSTSRIMFPGGSQDVPVNSNATPHPVQAPPPPIPSPSFAMGQSPPRAYLSIPSFSPPMALFPMRRMIPEFSPIQQSSRKDLITDHEPSSLERPLDPGYLLGLEDWLPQAGDIWKNIDKSLFTRLMKGKDRCKSCLRGKKGKVNTIFFPLIDIQCLRNPRHIDWPCLRCIDKNKIHKCEFFRARSRQSIEDILLSSSVIERGTLSVPVSQELETHLEVPEFQGPSALLQLGEYIGVNDMRHLDQFLACMLQARGSFATNLKATVRPSREPNGTPWCPIIRWSELPSIEAILAIKLQPDQPVNSFVLFEVTKTIGGEGNNQKSLRLTYSLLEVREFGELVSVGRRYFERMAEPVRCGLGLSKGPAFEEDVDVEAEMLNYAMVLMPVLYHLRLMEKNFQQQNGPFWIDRLSPRVVVDDGNGSRCTLLLHVVDL